jgi:type II secretory pathway component GspD/PulD (secretin)
MKKIAYNILLAGLASVLIARAQTNATTPGQPVDNTNTYMSLTTVSGTTNIVTTNTAPDAMPTTALVDTNTATVTTTVTTTVTSNSVLAAASATNATAPAVIGIPLIQFNDVPIQTAIENLARQAGINYMLDPKIGYGQPDATGQIKPEPTLSIRWENITAESALLALLDNYGLQLVVDKKTGIDRVALKDPLAPPPLITRVIQLQYASVSNMVESVQSVLGDKRSRVIADTRTSQLLVVATDPEQQSVDTLIAQLDKQTKQVLIETKLIEISSTPTAKRGVDWSSTLNAQHVTFGNGSIISDPQHSSTTITTPGPTTTHTTPATPPAIGHTYTTTAPYSQNGILTLLQGGSGVSASTLSGLIPTTGFLNADGVSAVISFLNASYDAQVVSTPRVVTLDNQTAHIDVTRTYPIINVTGGTQNSSGSSSVTYSNIGTILEVTPRISANDFIWLKVIPEVSSHFNDIPITIAGGGGNSSTTFTVPIFDRRRIESQVMIPNGNTLVMGGLVQDSPNASYSKVPFLGDIPGLGWAFHSENKSMSKDNLIIFLTPTIVRDADFQPTPSTYLQSKPKTMHSPMNPHMPWDGAEPDIERGWNNPAPIPGEFDGSRPTK